MSESTAPATPRPDGPEEVLDTGRPAGLACESEAARLPAALRQALTSLARTPRLLVVCDYDGTLAPVSEDPRDAVPIPEAISALLRTLARLPETTAAVFSGRALRDLAGLSRLPAEVHLLGSLGSEFDIGFVHALAPAAKAILTRLRVAVEDLAGQAAGASFEVKPAGRAVHLRKMPAEGAARLVDEIRQGPATWIGVHVTHGHKVVELSAAPIDNGEAVEVVRREAVATATIVIGGSPADENGARRLSDTDAGLKVDVGESLAGYRVGTAADVPVLLAHLAEERRAWFYGRSAPPIERLTMLAGECSVALLTPDARLTWFCHPEADSGAVFADLLGGPAAGHFSIRPVRAALPLGQRYVPGTMTVETRWSRLLLTDYLDHDPGPYRTDLVRVLTGSVPARVEFAPRPEFGAIPVRLRRRAEGLVVTGTTEPMVLRAPGIEWHIEPVNGHDTAIAEVPLRPGHPVVLELRCGTEDLSAHRTTERERRAQTENYWSGWSGRLHLPGLHRELVERSALTLRGLCHTGTGAIMAAATTSLPREIGGVRNWDHRYCRLRDAALTAQTLAALGSTDEADGYLRWLHGVLTNMAQPERLHPLYTLAGTAPGSEAVIDSLPGYAGSRPVRVGNLAYQQVRLDIFGPVADLITELARRRGVLTDAHWEVSLAMANAVTRRWQEPDHGIWEERGEPRHHVSSKTMCWLTIDRVIKLAGWFGRPGLPHWESLRTAIAEDVLANGWSDNAKAYTAAYDGTDLDASSLFIGLSGLLDPADERFRATVAAIETELRCGGTVFRYRRADGLPGQDAGFHLCTAWLVEAYLLTGRRADAEELFTRLADAAGPTGLLPEEYDPATERGLGNHPQAGSHLGLIRCALLLARTGTAREHIRAGVSGPP